MRTQFAAQAEPETSGREWQAQSEPGDSWPTAWGAEAGLAGWGHAPGSTGGGPAGDPKQPRSLIKPLVAFIAVLVLLLGVVTAA